MSKDLEGQIKELVGEYFPCHCDPAYTVRGLVQPGCPCEDIEDLVKDLLDLMCAYADTDWTEADAEGLGRLLYPEPKEKVTLTFASHNGQGVTS